MKKLIPPINIDHAQELQDIIEAKRNGPTKRFLRRTRPAIVARYTDYINQFNASNLIPLANSAYPGDARVLACYLSGGTRIAAIKSAIEALQDEYSLDYCMYCRIGRPDSFDHYLPKDDYPEYCALALNLIPCCIRCNKKKDRYWKENGAAGIVNFYIDAMPIHQILFVNITFNAADNTPIVTFSIDNRNMIDVNVYNLFSRHYTRLDLLNRYKREINSVTSEFKRTLDRWGQNISLANNQQYTLEYAQSLKVDYGINYWKGIFFEELSTKAEFFQ
jgi:hypothetical protein